MRLDPLYHWAPSERRRGILQSGLVPYSHPVTHAARSEADEARLSFPYICLGPTPSLAWAYGAASRDGLEDEYDGWDLWQVRLHERADVYVLPFWGTEVQEVRVRSAVGADGVWYVATRRGLSAEAAYGDEPKLEVCKKCKGRGMARGEPCPDCGGRGHGL